MPWVAFLPESSMSSFECYSYEAMGEWPGEKRDKFLLHKQDRESGSITVMDRDVFAAETRARVVGDTKSQILSYPHVLHGGTATGPTPPLVVIDSWRRPIGNVHTECVLAGFEPPSQSLLRLILTALCMLQVSVSAAHH